MSPFWFSFVIATAFVVWAVGVLYAALYAMNSECDRLRALRRDVVQRPSNRCAPEVIDPRPRRRRGACGVLGCPNVRPHSHVADLMRRLKEPRQ